MLASRARPFILRCEKTTSRSIPRSGGQARLRLLLRTRHRVDKGPMRFPTVRATAVALVLTLGGGIALMAQEQPAAPDAPVDVADVPRSESEIYSDLTLFGIVFDRIRNEYVDAPDEKELIRAAIQGMLTSLDPHSGYLPPDDFTQTQEDNAGEFGGLGIEVTMEEGI